MYFGWKQLESAVQYQNSKTERKKYSLFLVFNPSFDGHEKARQLSIALKAILLLDSELENKELRLLAYQDKINESHEMLNNVNAVFAKEVAKLHVMIQRTRFSLDKKINYLRTINQFDFDPNSKLTIVEGWCHTPRIPELCLGMKELSLVAPNINTVVSVIESDDNGAPSSFFSTPFLNPFLNMTFAYSIPKNSEINPALFMTFSFPFMFALMFGDLGHGIMLLQSTLILAYLFRQPKYKNGIAETIVSGQYLLIVLSIFSMLIGIIYNEAFAMPLTLFSSSFISNLQGSDKTVVTGGGPTIPRTSLGWIRSGISLKMESFLPILTK